MLGQTALVRHEKSKKHQELVTNANKSARLKSFFTAFKPTEKLKAGDRIQNRTQMYLTDLLKN